MSVSDVETPESSIKKSSGLLRNSLINSSFTLISRFAGFARDLVLAAYLGASGNIMADAYATAQNFPNLFRRIFAEGAFSSAFVPSYSAAIERETSNRYGTGFNINYTLTDHTHLSLGYQYVLKVADPAIMGYYQNLVTLGFTYQF